MLIGEDLRQALVRARRVATPRVHPNGFIQLDLNAEGTLRLHVWPDGPFPKQRSDSTIHEHILFKRINKAKQLLREGSTVTDTCQLAGFNDYSNFIRTFKKAVGLPPRQYQSQQRRV